MGQAERITDRTELEAQASVRYGSRGVPADWYVDPADPTAAERYHETSQQSLENQATAFLAAHQALAADVEDLQADETRELAAPRILHEVAPPQEQAVWIGLPGFGSDFDDEGELGWQADALCAQTDPEAFFPEKGGSTRDAKKVCGACTVRAQCLEYALANDERFGIWGGLSERERRRLRKRAV